MKNKPFDCVEMKRQGAEAVYQNVASLTIEQQLEYWRKGSASLRRQIQAAAKINASTPV
jgi:hypothetical protein